MAQVTIEDVAKAAGVSTFTVSRALRGMDHVAPRTREKVLQAAKELNSPFQRRRPHWPAGRPTVSHCCPATASQVGSWESCWTAYTTYSIPHAMTC